MGYYEAGRIDSLESKKGTLYKLETDGKLSSQFSGIDLSNGLAWSPDDTTFYYVDSMTYRVDAFDFDSVSGTISE